MAIKREFLEYLDHLGSTCPVAELAQTPTGKNRVALRHDIDHNLDLALEVAHHEHERGARATFYLLHTAAYWDDPAFSVKCRQLVEYGHEVGLHVNLVGEWADGAIDDLDARLGELLARLRGTGVSVSGVAAHGDKACYRLGCANYWLWREHRPADPFASEHGRSAEGSRVDDPQRQIDYPPDHRVTDGTGRVLKLWSLALGSHGVTYEAARVPCERYWSDSGGRWAGDRDPLRKKLSRGRHVVLMHPWWWRDRPRTIVLAAPTPNHADNLIDALGAVTNAAPELAASTRILDQATSESALPRVSALLDRSSELWAWPPSHGYERALTDSGTYEHPGDPPEFDDPPADWAWRTRAQRIRAHAGAAERLIDRIPPERRLPPLDDPSRDEVRDAASALGLIVHPLLLEERTEPESASRPLTGQDSIGPPAMAGDPTPDQRLALNQACVTVKRGDSSLDSQGVTIALEGDDVSAATVVIGRGRAGWHRTDSDASVSVRHGELALVHIGWRGVRGAPIRVFAILFDEFGKRTRQDEIGILMPGTIPGAWWTCLEPSEHDRGIAIGLIADRDAITSGVVITDLEIACVDHAWYHSATPATHDPVPARR